MPCQLILWLASAVSNEGRSSPLLVPVPPFLGPGFWLGARWNRLGEAVKTRKKREKTGEKWARYGLKRVKESGSPGDVVHGVPDRSDEDVLQQHVLMIRRALSVLRPEQVAPRDERHPRPRRLLPGGNEGRPAHNTSALRLLRPLQNSEASWLTEVCIARAGNRGSCSQ